MISALYVKTGSPLQSVQCPSLSIPFWLAVLCGGPCRLFKAAVYLFPPVSGPPVCPRPSYRPQDHIPPFSLLASSAGQVLQSLRIIILLLSQGADLGGPGAQNAPFGGNPYFRKRQNPHVRLRKHALSIISQHNYPFPKSWICPTALPISPVVVLTRTDPGFWKAGWLLIYDKYVFISLWGLAVLQKGVTDPQDPLDFPLFFIIPVFTHALLLLLLSL